MRDRFIDWLEREPARFVGYCLVIGAAIITALLAFGLVTEKQAAAMVALLGAFGKVATDIVRSVVMPMHRVAELVEAPVDADGNRVVRLPPPPRTPSPPPGEAA